MSYISDSKYLSYSFVFFHVLHKGIQLGSVFGTLGGTVFSLWKGGLSRLTVARLGSGAISGAVVGALLTSGLYVKTFGDPDRDVKMSDRAYRLQFNRGQNIMCATTLSTSAVLMFFSRSKKASMVGTFCLGQALGTVGFFVASVLKDKNNPIHAWNPK